MVNFSSHHEFEYKIGYPVALAGEALTLPSRASLKLLSHVISPLKEGSKVKAIATKIGACALVILSLPYNLTLGLIGLSLTILTSPFRKNVVIVSPEIEIVDDSPRELKICTFNTALLPDIINALKPNAPESHIRPMEGTTEERVEKIACELLRRKDDIVCLQEVLEPKAARLLVQKLSQVYPHSAYNVGAKGWFLNSGLMVVSKYPLKEPQFIPFTESRGADSWAEKGVLGLTVCVGGWEVNVLNTHMNSDSGLFGWKEGVQATRLKQLTQVRDLSDTYGEELEAKVVCGDFNMSYLPEEGDVKISEEFDVAKVDWGIDYILVSKLKQVYQKISDRIVDQMNDVSDHPAVRVVIVRD
jgi:endonuclease/exonuclease/phosphatase family metal-dependent hydrolase